VWSLVTIALMLNKLFEATAKVASIDQFLPA
jgi:hypothetical protein